MEDYFDVPKILGGQEPGVKKLKIIGDPSTPSNRIKLLLPAGAHGYWFTFLVKFLAHPV